MFSGSEHTQMCWSLVPSISRWVIREFVHIHDDFFRMTFCFLVYTQQSDADHKVRHLRINASLAGTGTSDQYWQ